MPLLSYRGIAPQVAETVYIAPSAYLIGQVEVAERASIWFNAVLRGDMAAITIGPESNLQDNVTVHVDDQKPTVIGSKVTVGHNSVLHGCTVEDGALIGMGSIILNGAVIGCDSLIAAGSLITPGTVIPPRSLVMGLPGKVVRTLSDDQLPNNGGLHLSYLLLAEEYRADR